MANPTAADDIWKWATRFAIGAILGWCTWATVQINETQREVAVINSNRYTPKDRLEDMKTEVVRYDQINKRVDAVFERLGHIEGDIKELKAVLVRMEQSIGELARRKDNP